MDLNIPGYDILEQIGEGGMAKVYLARHKRLDRNVAIKVLLARYAKDPAFAERFLREARIAAKLNHPNIVQIYDVNRHEDTLFISMEYVSGGDLNQKIQSPIRITRCAEIIRQLSEALDYAHSLGYIHRDIKPANILFRENGSLAISDFGIAKAMDSDTNMTQTGLVVGTPSFMSPEQAQGLPLSGRSDLYSVATIAYQILLGYPPYQADSSITVAIKHISDPIPTLPDEMQDFQTFFNQGLAKKADDRFENGHALAKLLNKVIQKRTKNTEDITLAPTLISGKQATAVSNHTFIENTQRDTQLNSTLSRFTHLTIHMVFLQFNRFFFFIKQPNEKIRWLLALLICVNILALSVYLVPRFLEEPVLSPAEQVKLAQLVKEADTLFSEGHLIGEGSHNALAKYRAILELSPNDPLAEDGINKIQTQLSSLFYRKLQKEDFLGAKQTLKQLSDLPNSENHVQRLDSAFDDAYQKKEKEIDDQLIKIKKYVKEKQYNEAITSYTTLKANNHFSSIDEAIDALTKILLKEGQKAHRQARYNEAIITLNTAERSAELSNNQTQLKLIDRTRYESREQLRIKQHQAKISALLSKAESAYKKAQFIQPERENAVYLYREILKLDASNASARNGLKTIFEAIVNRIEDAIDQKRFSQARVSITRFENIEPNHVEISRLKQSLASAIKSEKLAQAKEKKISTLYTKAYTYLKSNRPKRADKVYNQIEKLDKNHKDLQRLGEVIADGYVYLAQREINAKDWEDVEVWVKRGLKHKADHEELLKLRALAQKNM